MDKEDLWEIPCRDLLSITQLQGIEKRQRMGQEELIEAIDENNIPEKYKQ